MKLNQIANNPGAHKHKHKVGRGSSSGLGKTSGRGVKGAKARTGTKVYGFEGGQMPLHMRMPKRGFRNIFGTDFAEVNVNRIQKAIDNKKLDIKAKITEEILRKAGLVHKSKDGVRLLGKGSITAKIDIGFGNALYLRGEGAGLSWDRGTKMNCVNDDTWMLELGESVRPVIYKFLVNDLTWSAGEDYIVPAGASVTVFPAF